MVPKGYGGAIDVVVGIGMDGFIQGIVGITLDLFGKIQQLPSSRISLKERPGTIQ